MKVFGESLPCPNCELLRQLLDEVRFENQRLMNQFVFVEKIREEKPIEQDHEPIRPGFIPFRIQKQLLENEARQKARILSELSNGKAPKTIEELEQEVGLDASSIKESV